MAKILTLALCLVGVVIIQGVSWFARDHDTCKDVYLKSVKGVPLSYDDIITAANTGEWQQVQDLLSTDLAKQTAFKPISFNSVRNLKPPQDGQVYGEAEYSYRSASNIDGKTSEDAGGHKIINNNGKVKEFHFTPTEKLQFPPHKDFFPLTMLDSGISDLKHAPISFSSVRNLKPAPDGQVYGEAEYTYHTASNINGQTSEDAGGHKVINDNGHVKEFNIKPDTGNFFRNLNNVPLPALPPPPPPFGF